MMMQEPIRVADETFVLAWPLDVPGFGTFYVNSMVIRGSEPILVDTLAPVVRDEYLRTVFSLVDPADVRWVFLSHDDRDHSGNIMQVLEMCPNARLVTNFVGVGRMTEEWDLPLPRLNFVNDGDSFTAGDRTLVALRPPFYDSPATRGLFDPVTRTYFAADSFGAVVQEHCETVDEVPADVYQEGFNWFNRANHPWHEVADPAKIQVKIDQVAALGAEVIVSCHAPTAIGRTEQLCTMLSGITAMAPLALPGQAELDAMLAQMAAGAPPATPPPT